MSQIAADYKISSGRVSQIVGLLEQKQDNIEADRQATTDSVVGKPGPYSPSIPLTLSSKILAMRI